MPSRNVYHVVPFEDAWAVRREGAQALTSREPSEDDALRAAVDVVKTLGVGRIVVHGGDGRILAVHTYDQLPSLAERSWLDAVGRRPLWAGAAALALVGVGVALARRG